MDHLNKQQIVLLCLLVSFVTAIVTGIVTISLSEQSSKIGVSQTVYKVIERTIEKVTEPDSPVRNIVTKEPEKVTTSAQLSLEDIGERAGNDLVRIYKRNSVGGDATFFSLGLIVGSNGSVLGFGGQQVEGFAEFFFLDNSNKEIALNRNNTPIKENFYLYKTTDPKNSFKASLKNESLDSYKIGTNIVAFGGKEQNNIISTGIITEFLNTPEEKPVSVFTDLKLSSKQSGFLLLDTKANIIAFADLALEGEGGVRYIDARSVFDAIKGEI